MVLEELLPSAVKEVVCAREVRLLRNAESLERGLFSPLLFGLCCCSLSEANFTERAARTERGTEIGV